MPSAFTDKGRHEDRAEPAHAAELERKVEEIERALAESRRADEAKDHFIAVLSHDLRAPIHAVLGWAQLLRSPVVSEAERERAVVIIERNARAQLRLVEELLDATRIAANQVTLDVASVDLLEIVRRAIDGVGPASGGRTLALCAEPGMDPHVLGDRARLEQIVNNLLSNALKFTSEGGTIAVELTSDEDAVVLRMTDDGVGIAREMLPNVFDRFRQAPGSAAHRSGVGLGLYIVQQIVELHGGTVEARSNGPGHGTTFLVRLPAATPVVAPAVSSSPFVLSATPSLAGVDVLLVDDDADCRELMTAVITKAGATVRSVGTLVAALELFDARRPDAVVSDIRLPDRDGYALVRALRRRAPRIPTVAVSGFVARAHVERAIAAGFDLHFAKPVEGHRLVAALAELTR